MLENIYAVIDRINEIQKRFRPPNNPVANETDQNTGKFRHLVEKHVGEQNQAVEIKEPQITEPGKNLTIPEIRETAKKYAVKNGLPPSLVNAVIKVESGFNPFAVSNKGAKGLMQLMPLVSKELGIENPFNIDENIKGGVNFLKHLLQKYDWDLKKALAAYNAGETAVDKNNGVPPYKETRNYVKKVINAYIQNIE